MSRYRYTETEHSRETPACLVVILSEKRFNSAEDSGQKMELAGTRPTHTRAPPVAPSPVNCVRPTHENAFCRRTKSKYRESYKIV